MGKGKPRHNPDKPQNKFKHCVYDDGTKGKECNRPYSYKCDGNMYNCYKLYLQYLATLSEKERKEFLEKNADFKWGAPRTNYESINIDDR